MYHHSRACDLDFVEGFNQSRDKFIIEGVLYEDTAACAADLTLVKEDAKLCAVHGLFKIAVVEINVSALAA